MSNREGELTFFQFVCPPDRADEVKALFKERQLGSVCPELQEETRILVSLETEEDIYVSGLRVDVIGRRDKKDEILHELSSRGIAGFSRETQILRSPAETIVWKQE